MTRSLVIAAHPDDDLLGVGGTMLKRTARGDEFVTLICTQGGDALGISAEERARRNDDAVQAAKAMGASRVVFLDFEAARLESVGQLQLINELARVVREVKPEVVYTHHVNDTHQDHRAIAMASQIALRPDRGVRTVYAYECPSSSTFQLFHTLPFQPNHFEDITSVLARKKEIMSFYSYEARALPSPRSAEGIEAYARYRGITSGVEAAEAFCLLRNLEP